MRRISWSHHRLVPSSIRTTQLGCRRRRRRPSFLLGSDGIIRQGRRAGPGLGADRPPFSYTPALSCRRYCAGADLVLSTGPVRTRVSLELCSVVQLICTSLPLDVAQCLSCDCVQTTALRMLQRSVYNT